MLKAATFYPMINPRKRETVIFLTWENEITGEVLEVCKSLDPRRVGIGYMEEVRRELLEEAEALETTYNKQRTDPSEDGLCAGKF